MLKVLNKKIAKQSLLGLIFLCTFGGTVFAQESSLGNWLIYIGNKKINNQWNIHHEVQYRNYNAIGDLEQLLLRTGLGYTFDDGNSNFLLGYGYILSQNYPPNSSSKVDVNEHRIFQQFITKQTVAKVSLSHRYRLEQRFVEDVFKVRFRYFLSAALPLEVLSESLSKFYLSAYNEIFLNAESSIFDRNRLYGGLGFRWNDNVKTEIGYMNQFFELSGRDQINIMAFVNF